MGTSEALEHFHLRPQPRVRQPDGLHLAHGRVLRRAGDSQVNFPIFYLRQFFICVIGLLPDMLTESKRQFNL